MPGPKVLVFGGSFDPPHRGHLTLLQNAVAALRPNRVLVVPNGTPPHKGQSHTPPALRLAMCECFRPAFAGLEVSEIEVHRQGKSYSYDTLCTLRAALPGAELYLLVGGDMLEGFTAWRNWQGILQLATLVAGSRQKGGEAGLEAAAETLRAAGGTVLMAPGPVLELSSTALRAAVAEGNPDAFALIPPPADDIVRENGLYQTPQ